MGAAKILSPSARGRPSSPLASCLAASSAQYSPTSFAQSPSTGTSPPAKCPGSTSVRNLFSHCVAAAPASSAAPTSRQAAALAFHRDHAGLRVAETDPSNAEQPGTKAKQHTTSTKTRAITAMTALMQGGEMRPRSGQGPGPAPSPGYRSVALAGTRLGTGDLRLEGRRASKRGKKKRRTKEKVGNYNGEEAEGPFRWGALR